MIEYNIDIDKAKENGLTIEEVEEAKAFADAMNYLQMEGFIEVKEWDEETGEPKFGPTERD